ncbi:hypothetical protein KC865_03085 [Candidatus Kaiserbacteria bacterium]|nr:hypothetical protein [Candidatus Kaiserbacteria bacterium]USN91930.1 MAG: hypothetical protein H6782_03580 [Candidatus Nomurabacteria bacterium]
MSQKTLIEKIAQDASNTVAEIKSKGATEIEVIQRETERMIAELNKSQNIALEKKKAQMELVAISRAKQTGNISIQSAKRDCINEIFDEVCKELEEQSADEYVTFFKKHAVDTVPKTVEVVKIHAPAKRREETGKILESLGLTGEIVADSDIKAGLVVYAKDGVYDVTLGRLMGERRADLEMLVVSKVMS